MGEEAQAAAAPLEAPRVSGGKEEEFSSFDETEKFNFPVFLNWVTAILAIAGTVFFYLLSKDLGNKIAALSEEKQEVVSEMTSPTYAQVEKQAAAFKSAVTELEKAQKNRYPLNSFFPKFYGRLAKNVEVTNLVLSAEGKISISGKTKSYRAVADQLLILRDWKVDKKNVLSNVELLTVSEAIKDEKTEASFSIIATLDKSVDLMEEDAVVSPVTTTETVDDSVAVPSAIDSEAAQARRAGGENE